MGSTYYFPLVEKKNLDSQLRLEIFTMSRFENLSCRYEIPLILGEWIRLFQRYKFGSEAKNLILSFYKFCSTHNLAPQFRSRNCIERGFG